MLYYWSGIRFCVLGIGSGVNVENLEFTLAFYACRFVTQLAALQFFREKEYIFTSIFLCWFKKVLDVTVFKNFKFKLSEDAFKVTYQIVALIVFVILGEKIFVNILPIYFKDKLF